MFKFFCDTDCELDYRTVKELNIPGIIYMPYTICNKEYFCDLGENFDPKWFYNLVREGNIPITSALNVEDYKNYIEPVFKAGDDIFYVSFGDKFSGTFNYLDIALKELKKTYPNRKLIRYDTKAISMATGIAVHAAAKAFIHEGKSVEETIALLDELCPRINAVVIADDLQHLKRGGRLSGATAFIGGILKIKPIIKLTDEGKLESKEKASGINKAIALVAEQVIADVRDTDKYPIVVLDADNKEDGDKLEQKLREGIPGATIWRYDVGPVIGTHAGPGTLALCYVGTSRPAGSK